MDPKSQDAGLASQALASTSEDQDLPTTNNASKDNVNRMFSNHCVNYYQ